MVLGSSGTNSMRRTRLYGASCRRAKPEDRLGQFPARLRAGHEDQIGLGHRQAQWVGAGHHGHLGHRLVLDQRALQLERADAVVGGLEHVVGATDVGDVAVGVARRHVAGVVVAVAHRLGVFSALSW